MTPSESIRHALADLPPGAPLLAVVGPTATGKSDYAIALCRQFGGEAISADSRQIYRGLDLGSGKVEGRLDRARARGLDILGATFEVAPFDSEGVTHWLLDICAPEVVVTAAQYQRLAYDVMADVYRRGRLPVLVGGTGLYVHAVVDGLVMPDVAPDLSLRAALEGLSVEALRARLLTLDPLAGTVVDLNNPRRMVRAVEVAAATGSVAQARGRADVPFRTLMLGVEVERTELLTRIRRRLDLRLAAGMIEEVERLAAEGLSHDRMEDLGLEYRYLSRYVRGAYTRDEMRDELERAIARFARRQMTWFRKRGPLTWVASIDEALAVAGRWLDQRNSGGT